MQTPIPAATLVIFRERADGPPDLLFVERARAMAFAAGALVFPGGRIDPGDRALAAAFDGDADETAGRIAAIRETLEEAGIPIGLDPLPGTAALAAIREGLHAGEALADLIGAAGCALMPDRLVPFARWCPQFAHPRIFDTLFFLARLPAGAPEPIADKSENVGVFWRGARETLADADAGRAHLIFPTRRNLERLARFDSFAAAEADALAHPIRTVTPWIEHRSGGDHLCIPDDLGYPITAVPLDAETRG